MKSLPGGEELLPLRGRVDEPNAHTAGQDMRHLRGHLLGPDHLRPHAEGRLVGGRDLQLHRGPGLEHVVRVNEGAGQGHVHGEGVRAPPAYTIEKRG